MHCANQNICQLYLYNKSIAVWPEDSLKIPNIMHYHFTIILFPRVWGQTLGTCNKLPLKMFNILKWLTIKKIWLISGALF